MSNNCGFCGAEFARESAKFCGKCGRKRGADAAAATPPAKSASAQGHIPVAPKLTSSSSSSSAAAGGALSTKASGGSIGLPSLGAGGRPTSSSSRSGRTRAPTDPQGEEQQSATVSGTVFPAAPALPLQTTRRPSEVSCCVESPSQSVDEPETATEAQRPASQASAPTPSAAAAAAAAEPVNTPSTQAATTASLRHIEVVREVLREAEMEHHLSDFEAARIDDGCLQYISEDDLEKIGLTIGAHRKKLLQIVGRRFSSHSAASESLPHGGGSISGSRASATSSLVEGDGDRHGATRKGSGANFDNALSTLKPDGISPEMLQTDNADEFLGWRQGPMLGKGSYGAVYVALLPSGQFFAVKKVELGGAQGIRPSELVALSREITMMRRIAHPNVCQFAGCMYDASENSILMFMEYISGGSLSSVVKKFKPLPEALLQGYTIQILRGLAYLHAQNCSHRDIKGENVLVDMHPHRPDWAIKLADFGAAKKLNDAVGHTKTVVGTPFFIAPEVVLSNDGYDTRADIWSLGCTVCEMVSGRPPWPAKANLPAAILMIAQAKDGPTEIPEADMTPGCLAFVRRCFARNPAERPSAEELLLDPWLRDHPLQRVDTTNTAT